MIELDEVLRIAGCLEAMADEGWVHFSAMEARALAFDLRTVARDCVPRRRCSMDAIKTGEQADYECRERIMHCSNCNAEFGYVLYSEDGDVSMDDKPNYCPNCRAEVI